jgi:acyl-CoA reductase-like NAD-dependent aldehyde dehydrogenase
VLSGGTRVGSVVRPTVLSQVTPGMKVSCQEVFGPLVTITPYHEFDDVLKAVNESDYGLQAGVFTSNIGRIFQAFEQLEVGAVPGERNSDVPRGPYALWRGERLRHRT